MLIDRLTNILVSITLIEMMVSIGLGVTFAQVLEVAKNGRQVAQAAVANYVLVPAAAVALLLLFHASPMVEAGFLIVAVCPGAPYGPPFTAMAKGNEGVAVGLMVILAGSSAVVAPLLLGFLLPVLARHEAIEVDVGKIVGTLLVTQLLPLLAGLVVRQRRPALALKLQKPFKRLSAILNISVFVVIIAVQHRTLGAVRLMGLVGMLALLVCTVAAGWLLGGPGKDNRKAMALTTSVRNVGVSLVIATGSFPGTSAVTAALAYAVFQTIVMASAALAWGRLSSLSSAAQRRA